MRYSIEPRDKMYVKECGFLYFAKDMGKILNNRYCQKKSTARERYIFSEKRQQIIDELKLI